MKISSIIAILLASLSLSLPGCSELDAKPQEGEEHGGHSSEEGAHEQHKILVTSPVVKDVISTQRYVCQIHSRRHIEVRALEGGYLEEIPVKEGQLVKKGELMFKILPTIYQARLDADIAEKNLAEIELKNTQKLYDQQVGGRSVVAQPEVAMAKAKLAKAIAEVELAQAELNFANIRAPFDGIVGQQEAQQGSLIDEGDTLTTFSDNSVMWVYFNVPEARYLEYRTTMDSDGDMNIELELANKKLFPQPGEIGAIEADFNNETGNIAFRADFPNPTGLLRNGQTGTILIHRDLKGALVIPQRATYEILAKRYVYVVDDEGVVHQRDITVQNEMEDIFVIKKGLQAGEKIVLEGIREVHDGDHVEFEFRDPEEVLANLKYKAE